MRSLFVAIVLTLCCSTYSAAQLDEVLKKAEGLGQHNTSGLSDDKIISGLKEALQVSTSKAVARTGKPDGFLKNEAIKIVLPPKLETIGKGMRMLGMGAKVDELEVGMNRAAEQATPEAKQIFLAALKKMTFDDARETPTFDGGSFAGEERLQVHSGTEVAATSSDDPDREGVGRVEAFHG